jgi:hypothetical protein
LVFPLCISLVLGLHSSSFDILLNSSSVQLLWPENSLIWTWLRLYIFLSPCLHGNFLCKSWVRARVGYSHLVCCVLDIYNVVIGIASLFWYSSMQD